jgi:hypothetical protein
LFAISVHSKSNLRRFCAAILLSSKDTCAHGSDLYKNGAEDPQFMPKRLAITISGAVSLGSYEAGVLYEVVNAIGQHNSQPDTNTALNETDQIGPIRYPNPEPLRAIDVQLDGLTLDRMDRQPREQVRDRLCDRAHEIAEWGRSRSHS